MRKILTKTQKEPTRRLGRKILLAVFTLAFIALLACSAAAAPKVHVVTFGKWTTVQRPGATEDGKPVSCKVRALAVDGRVKEYTLGATHEVTDRLFVVQRAFRINDSLPDETTPHWQWQPGGWLMVDRLTGRISPLTLPEFDSLYSAASWYRDYVAFCGLAEDGKKLYAVVAQIGRRKPVLKKILSDEGLPDSASGLACPAPPWQRTPTRVSFEPSSGKQIFAIRGRIVDVVNDDEEDADESEGSK
jgi:hypothetical protein